MSGERSESARSPVTRWRWGLWVVVAGLAALMLWRDPSDAMLRAVWLVVSTGVLVALAFAVQYVELRTQRPRKTYLRWAVMAAVLGLALVVMPLAIGAGVAIGLILWVGFSASGLAWVYFYERTEPR